MNFNHIDMIMYYQKHSYLLCVRFEILNKTEDILIQESNKMM